MKVLKFNENIETTKYYKKIDSSTSSMYIKIDLVNHYYIKIFTVGEYVKILKDPDAVHKDKYSNFLPSNSDEFNSAMETAIASIKG